MHFLLRSLQFPWQLCVAWALVSPLRQASLCEVTNKTFSLFISPSLLQYKLKHFLLTIPVPSIHTGIIPVHSFCPPLWNSGRVANGSVIMPTLVRLKSAIMSAICTCACKSKICFLVTGNVMFHIKHCLYCTIPFILWGLLWNIFKAERSSLAYG